MMALPPLQPNLPPSRVISSGRAFNDFDVFSGSSFSVVGNSGARPRGRPYDPVPPPSFYGCPPNEIMVMIMAPMAAGLFNSIILSFHYAPHPSPLSFSLGFNGEAMFEGGRVLRTSSLSGIRVRAGEA